MRECPSCGWCGDDADSRCPRDGTALDLSFSGTPVVDGTYRLLSCLGRGGMGSVYRAQHVGLSRTFALKLISPEFSGDAYFLRGFRVEAAALGRLKHPGIVGVTDFGIDEPRGMPYLVMEDLEGVSLTESLDQCHDVEFWLTQLSGIAAALDYAHSRGVLHRDLKPDNVLLVDGEVVTPKLLDFGIAKFWDSVHPQTAAPPGSPIGGAVGPDGPQELGTVAYMAPETFGVHRSTPAQDIYALGVMGFEVLAGRRPFVGERQEVREGHLSHPPPAPSSLNAALPRELDAPLLRMLAKDPEGRPARASLAVDAISQAWMQARLARWRRTERPRRVLAAVALALICVVTTVAISRVSLMQSAEALFSDLAVSTVAPVPPSPDVILVSIDDRSLAADSAPLAAQADQFGVLVNAMFDAGARGVAVDLLLPASWSQSKPFADMVIRHADQLTLSAFSGANGVVGPECVEGLVTALLGTSRANSLFGFVNVSRDIDGVIRETPVTFTMQSGDRQPSFAARAAETLGRAARVAPRTVMVDSRIQADLMRKISWRDVPAVVAGEPGVFRDRLVLIGGEFAGAADAQRRLARSGDADNEVSGLTEQAVIVNTLLEGSPLRKAGRSTDMALWGLMAALVSASTLVAERTSIRIISACAAIAVPFAIALGALILYETMISPVAAATASLMGVLLANVVRARLTEPPIGLFVRKPDLLFAERSETLGLAGRTRQRVSTRARTEATA